MKAEIRETGMASLVLTLKVIGPDILILQVIGMLPNINAKQRDKTLHRTVLFQDHPKKQSSNVDGRVGWGIVGAAGET